MNTKTRAPNVNRARTARTYSTPQPPYMLDFCRTVAYALRWPLLHNTVQFRRLTRVLAQIEKGSHFASESHIRD